MRGVTILGATGSVGRHTLDVLSRHCGHFQVIAEMVRRTLEQCPSSAPDSIEAVLECDRRARVIAAAATAGAAERVA